MGAPDAAGEGVELSALAKVVNAPATFTAMARVGCTDQELADYFGVDRAAMVEQLGPLLRSSRAALQEKVRRCLFAAAEQQHQPDALATLVRMYLTEPPSPDAPAPTVPRTS
jgi:hypothetical protein